MLRLLPSYNPNPCCIHCCFSSGAVAVEFVYGNTVDMLWNAANAGKLAKDVDWSKWADDEEEEE